MLKMVDGTGIIGVDMVCPLGGAVSPPQPPNFDKVEMEGVGSLMLPNSLKAPIERLELIGNSMQGENPAPDNPQEIKSAGRKSKNLFDINYFKDKSNLKMLQCEGFTLLGIICNVKPNTEYTLSANLTEAKYNLNIANKTKRFSLTSAPSRTLTSNDDGTLYIGLFNTTADLINMDDFMQQYKNIQLEEGNKTDYEPYSDKYLLNVKVNGKNLFDREKARDINNWTDSIVQPGYIDFSIYVGKGNSVNISYSENLEAGLGFYAGIAQSVNNGPLYWLYHSLQQSLNKNNYKLIAECDYISVRVIKSNLQGFLEHIKTLQIENSNTPTSYEPYTEQSVQITLDEPLRGIGEYKDTITKDGIVRKIKRIVLDGSENWVIHKEKETTVSFWTNSFKFLFPTHNTMLVDKFAYVISGMNKEDVSWSVYGSNFYININKDIASNLESFKIWLSKNTVTVEYIAIEPTTEPLPESVQQQLQALHSENGTTHVFVDSGEVPCGIKLTYRKEK